MSDDIIMRHLSEKVIIFVLLVTSAFVKVISLDENGIINNTASSVCSEKKCFRKCCAENAALKEDQCQSIIKNDLPDILTFYSIAKNDNYTVIPGTGNFCVTQNTAPIAYYLQDFRFVGEDVYILEEMEVLRYPDFCLEYFFNKTMQQYEPGLLGCFASQSNAAAKVSCSGMIISMPFLLITFLVYAILPERNLHQRALMFYVLTLLLSYVLLVTINLSESLSSPWCEIFAYSTLFFFMVSFFWMNVICFDIWYTFSGGRGFVGSKRSSERRRLIFYSIYAFGVPIAVVALVLVLQKVLPEDSPHNPGIGKYKCFIADGWPNLWYFYVEAGILVITNIVFFLLTAIKIRQVKKETSMLKHNDSRRHTYEKDKQRFNLYVKLLFAMGVNWSMEVISFLVNWKTGGTIQYIWYATDFFNAVYGVFIFFIFVFKKKIWTLLQRRYYNFMGKPHLANTMTSTNTRTSHYSSTNYSTADTSLSDRTTVANGRARTEELALRPVT